MLKNNLGHNFPTADSLYDRVLASAKSYDTASKTYSNVSKWLSRMKADIRELDKFTSEQQEALQKAREYAQSLNIDVKVHITQ